MSGPFDIHTHHVSHSLNSIKPLCKGKFIIYDSGGGIMGGGGSFSNRNLSGCIRIKLYIGIHPKVVNQDTLVSRLFVHNVTYGYTSMLF